MIPAAPSGVTPAAASHSQAEGILGNVEELLAEVGQSVAQNEVVAVIETDKVTLDVKASKSGVVSAILVSVGDIVKERQPLYSLEE